MDAGVALILLPLALLGCVPVVEDADHDGIPAAEDCDDRDPRVGLGPEWYADADRDGFPDSASAIRACAAPEGFVGPEGACPRPIRGPSDCPADCDDADPDVHPRASETCDGVDQDCDGEIDEHALGRAEWHPDADGDGFADPDITLSGCERPADVPTESTDCDDADPSVFPGAAEVCDFVDQDCNGVVDDGLPVADWWRDADRDSYGAEGALLTACVEPHGYVSNADDCDDADREEFPGAVWHPDADGDGFGEPHATVTACERPAGYVVDATDCDDADPDAVPGALWAQDADGDGYGSRRYTLVKVQCERPGEDWVRDSTDCDDADGAVHPGAVELCDGTDDDCDGVADRYATGWFDRDGDGYGDPATETVGYCASGWVADGTDCDDAEDDVHPDAIEWCNGHDDDCDGLVDGDEAGDATWYADVDGDGWGDLASATTSCAAFVGYVDDPGDCAPDDGAISPGADEICRDGVDDDCDGSLDCPPGTPLVTGDRQLQYGPLAALGDADGDGYDEVLVGAYWIDESGRSRAGTTFHLRAPLPGDTAIATAGLTIRGADGDLAGSAVAAAGDLDGDGATDLAIGAPGLGPGPGSVWLLSDPTGDVELSSGFASIAGAPYGGSGGSVSAAGDLDGDGADDLLVGMPGWEVDWRDPTLGAVAVLYGPLSGSVSYRDGDNLLGLEPYERLGSAILGGHDFDGDGVPDVVAAGTEVVVVESGGSWSGTGVRGAATWVGGSEHSPVRLDSGDVDGDGLDDLVLGRPWENDVWITTEPLVGGATATDVLAGEPDGSSAGYAITVLDDVNGDGASEVLIGDVGAGDNGAIYLLFEPASGTTDLAHADAIWRGTSSTARIGTSLLATGDLDGDAVPDVLYGGYDASRGALFLISGGEL